MYEEEFNDSPTKHPNDNSEPEPCIPRPPFDSSSPTLGNPQQHDDTPKKLVCHSILLNLNTNGTESSEVSSDQDPIQSGNCRTCVLTTP